MRTITINLALWTREQKVPHDSMMSDFRCFSPDLDSEKEEITLTAFESHHLVGTNRAREGSEVAVFNGAGLEWISTLKKADRRRSILKKRVVRQYDKSPSEVTLAIALIKGKTFDSILRQATEMGVSRIQPLTTTWTQVHVKDASAKLEKWKQHLVEGCKQSGNPWLPELLEPDTIENCLKNHRIDCGVVASLENDATSWSQISPSRSSTLFVGPEGDFTPEEYQLLKSNGVLPVSLGPYVLRSETAAISALSILMKVQRSNS